VKSYQLQPTPRFQTRASIKIIPSTIPDICPYVSIIYIYMCVCVCIYIYTVYTHQISIIVPQKCWLKRPWCPRPVTSFPPYPKPQPGHNQKLRERQFLRFKILRVTVGSAPRDKGLQTEPTIFYRYNYIVRVYMYMCVFICFIYVYMPYILTSRRDPPKIQWNPAQLRCLRNV
jgi:hypothetical protein